mmetsp:Transcript_15090/g.36231  ORF Transcript_15090/g.36231 Transcript_15090/m.36231 type:complete len:317 (-) Transcript_15090:67-1017(-)
MGPLLALRLPQLIRALWKTQPIRTSDILINHVPHHIRYITLEWLENHRLLLFPAARIRHSRQRNSIFHNRLELGNHPGHSHVNLQKFGVRRIISHYGLLIRDALNSETCPGLRSLGTVALTELVTELGAQVLFEDRTDFEQVVVAAVHVVPPREGKISVGGEAMNEHGHRIPRLVHPVKANDGDGTVGCPQDFLRPVGILRQWRAPDHVDVEPLQIQVVLVHPPRGRGDGGSSPTGAMGIGDVAEGDVFLSGGVRRWGTVLLIHDVIVHVAFVVELRAFAIAAAAAAPDAFWGLIVEDVDLVAFPCCRHGEAEVGC